MATTVTDGLWTITSDATTAEILALLRAGTVNSANVIALTSEGTSKFACLYKIDKGTE